MRLGYFAMPMHPLDTDYTTTLKQDRETITLCDKLGYYDAFVGEHLSDDAENIANSMLFLSTLIPSTESIMFRTGTTNLTHTRPVLVASHWANYEEDCATVGHKADLADWRIARTIFVTDNENVAEGYGKTDANIPYHFYYSQLLYKLTKEGRQAVFKHNSDESTT
jgi:hypothetical protein